MGFAATVEASETKHPSWLVSLAESQSALSAMPRLPNQTGTRFSRMLFFVLKASGTAIAGLV
jgi:hypothetical protein